MREYRNGPRKEEIAANQQAYKETNRERYRGYDRLYEQKPERKVQRRIYAHLRRGLRGGEVFTAEDWENALIRFGYCCAYCGADGEMQQDHALPLSRGGTHEPGNIVPACEPCNKSKGRKTPQEFAVA